MVILVIDIVLYNSSCVELEIKESPQELRKPEFRHISM